MNSRSMQKKQQKISMQVRNLKEFIHVYFLYIGSIQICLFSESESLESENEI